ncbi:MAG: ion channel [Bacteroidota bacterium]
MKITDIVNPFTRNNRNNTVNDDLGFGSKLTADGGRLVNKDGTFNIHRRGQSTYTPYQWAVEISWAEFIGVVTVFFCITNALFAFGFMMLGVENISGIESSSFLGNFCSAFFFSVQTFTTVGYGSMSPLNVPTHLLASIDALVGLLTFALATGLLFAKFAKPKAQLIFSEFAIMAPYKKNKFRSFQFRIANLRNNKIIDAEAILTMTWLKECPDGNVRQFANLELERTKVALLPLNWTIVHPITAESPLYGKAEYEIEAMDVEFIVQIKAFDETFAQQVNAHSSYTFKEIKWNKSFERMYYSSNGKTILNLDMIDDVRDAMLPSFDKK